MRGAKTCTAWSKSELSYLGEGAQAAARRRVLARQLEEGRRRDRQATYRAHIRGRGLSRINGRSSFLLIVTNIKLA